MKAVTRNIKKVYQGTEEYVPEPTLEEIKRARNRLKNYNTKCRYYHTEAPDQRSGMRVSPSSFKRKETG